MVLNYRFSHDIQLLQKNLLSLYKLDQVLCLMETFHRKDFLNFNLLKLTNLKKNFLIKLFDFEFMILEINFPKERINFEFKIILGRSNQFLI